MGELSFLIELLLNHKLAKPTKELIAARIKDLEQGMPIVAQSIRPIVPSPMYSNPIISNQTAPIEASQQNSAVQAALAARAQAMGLAGSSNQRELDSAAKSIFKARPK